MSEIQRGGLGEPYCGAACYAGGGREIGMIVVHGGRGTCGFCQAPCTVSAGGPVKLIPYRGAILYICRDCGVKGADFIRNLRECCQCGKAF